ncbi:hypothetical protein Q5425_42890 [Amycolatopsis sp. A133]|uniref:hypothetical protein n=1 Tax=Amycolatopsis sp. A133 TaxID=3064472 RepID=UPI0027F1C17C|nr:hypothetical protein [Amycolatopsis sp. A133]MDQ7810514.1 hypothetical protein [Amycolatopsis sp. A133]
MCAEPRLAGLPGLRARPAGPPARLARPPGWAGGLRARPGCRAARVAGPPALRGRRLPAEPRLARPGCGPARPTGAGTGAVRLIRATLSQAPQPGLAPAPDP